MASSNKSVSLKVSGLSRLAGAFKKLDTDVPTRLKQSFLAIATTVAGKASAKVPVRTRRAAGSIKPRSTARGASIAFGGNVAPYMPWLDFGGSVGRNRSIHRPFIKSGRFVYPTIKEEGTYIREEVDKALEEAITAGEFNTVG